MNTARPEVTHALIGDYTFERLLRNGGVHYGCYLTEESDEEAQVITGAYTTSMFLPDGTNHLQHDGEVA